MTVALYSDALSSRIYEQGTGLTTPWNGTGTPWDTASTTPFELAMNETAGAKWTPTVSPKLLVLAGGPPLNNGSLPVWESVGNVSETLVVQARAALHENALTLKQTLEQFISLAFYSGPVMLEIAEHGSATHFEVYAADIQEDTRFRNDENNRGLLRLVVTLTRAPLATPASATTVLNAVSITNNGNDPKSMTIGGELKYIGQPLNVALSTGEFATAGVRNVWLASIYGHTYQSRSDAISTTSSTGVQIGGGFTITVNILHALKTRFVARVASPSANLQLQVRVQWGADTVYIGPWVTGGSTSGAVYDLGFCDWPPSVRRAAYTTGITYSVYARSTNGASATGTMTWHQAIDYFTWSKITVTSGTSLTHNAQRFKDTNVGGRVLTPPLYSLGTTPNQSAIMAGTLPMAYSASKLWVVWDSAGAHSNSATATCTAIYLPLYRTLIGPGVS